jgi:capsular polysaccharide biosynthesis protein
MELQDYAAALRRYWTTFVGLTVAGVLTALAVVLYATPAYQTTATVFVASTGEGTSGSQFVNQRVASYPDIAESRAVLAPVIEKLGIREPFPTLRAKLEAENPPDTSLVRITVTDDDPTWAADLANAVAEEFRSTVEALERPGRGETPVSLTVTDSATVPLSPTFPTPGLFLLMGAVVGAALGMAAAIVRNRRDTRIHRDDDVRAAWGAAPEELTVYSTSGRPRGRAARTRFAARPESRIARRLEVMAEQQPVRVVAVPVSPDGQPATRAFAREVAHELTDWDVPVTVDVLGELDAASPAPGVHLSVGTSMAPQREWRRLAREQVGVLLVLLAGRSEREDLRDLRAVLDAAQVQVIGIVLLPASARRTTGTSDQPPVGGTGETPAATVRQTVPVS